MQKIDYKRSIGCESWGSYNELNVSELGDYFGLHSSYLETYTKQSSDTLNYKRAECLCKMKFKELLNEISYVDLIRSGQERTMRLRVWAKILVQVLNIDYKTIYDLYKQETDIPCIR